MREWTPLTLNTILYCRHWKETVTFYRDKLGLPVLFSREGFAEFGIGDNARISIADEARSKTKSPDRKGITLTFQVRDIDGTRALFNQRGLNPTPVSHHPWGAKVFYLSDPDGHRVEIWTPA